MTGSNLFLDALAALELPTEWQVEVAIRPRRRSIALEVKPGGGVAVLDPPTADPEEVVWFVSSHRRWIVKHVSTAMRLAPAHEIKQFVDGEQFDLLGQRYQLQLVDIPPLDVGQLPAVTADHKLYVRRQRVEQVRRAIIGLYRQVGLDWVRRVGRQYELEGHIEALDYAVRDLGHRRWGAYYGPPKHITTLHWAVFGLPVQLVEYVLVHEQSHATRPAGHSHGRVWQRQMAQWMPGWQRRKAELAEVGRHCWLGDYRPRGCS